MAKQLAALLGGGLDLKALAEMLRLQGRGQDTILAHITPQEAALLKARGGAGTMNPATGLPEFQEDPMNYGFGYEGEPYSQEVTSPNITSQDISQPGNFPSEGEFGPSLPPVDMTGAIITETGAMPDYAPELNIGRGTYAPFIPTSFRPSMNYGEGMTGAATETFDRGVQAQAAPQRDLASMLKAGAKGVLGTREGLAGLGTAAALMQARQAGKQAQQMQRELSAIGAPQRALGQQMIAQGQRGEVTPVQRQQMAALDARQKQQLAQRGLTSSTAQQQQQLRMQEMQQRGAQDLIDQGIKIAGIGDQYQAAAIKAGYAADEATRNMLNTTLTNLYRTIYGNVATPEK